VIGVHAQNAPFSRVAQRHFQFADTIDAVARDSRKRRIGSQCPSDHRCRQ